ncbi:MAG: DUF4037 domain-containing protein [Cloacibacillus sp.]
MQGLELCRLFYEQCAAPEIEKNFGARASRVAAGLAGQGSDCLGYDDELSRDHDFGPGCCLWLTEADYADFGCALGSLYASLPKEFMGFRRNTMPQGEGRVGVMPASRFYRQLIGSCGVPQDEPSWFRIPEHFLAAATSGEVFRDDEGGFSRVRNALLRCYPRDVLLKKLAARLFVMAQAGQYNYPRIMKRNDAGAASLALAEFVSVALSALHLLNGRYTPYYKWAFRSARELPKLHGAVMELDGLYAATPCNRAEIIESVCLMVGEHLKKEGLSSCRDGFLVPHAEEIMRQIQSDYLKKMPISAG